MQSAPMKVTLVMVCALIFLPSELIDANPVDQPKLINENPGGCPCIVPGPGMCQEKDENDMYWCMVSNIPPLGEKCCDGGIYPKGNVLMTNCKNYSNCRLSGNVNNEGAANLDD